MRILITGVAGFIGSNFVKWMLNHHPENQYIGVDNLTYAGNLDNLPRDKSFEFHYGDVTDIVIVDELMRNIDSVVHFAAESHVQRSISNNRIFYETDTIGTQTISSAVCKHRVKRFVHISTSEVYGTAEYSPMDEKHPLNPCSPYASAKAGADRLVYSFWKTYDMPVAIVRPFNQYGPSQHPEKMMPTFIINALLNKPLTIHGNGSASRDWLYVEDLCYRISTILEKSDFQATVYNAGSGDNRNVLSIAKMILDILGKPSHPIEFIEDRRGQVARHHSSTDKLKELGVSTNLPFESGLEQTIQWYKDNMNWWKRLMI